MSETIISQKKSFLDLNESELNEILTKTGEKKFRIKQINNWIKVAVVVAFLGISLNPSFAGNPQRVSSSCCV